MKIQTRNVLVNNSVRGGLVAALALTLAVLWSSACMAQNKPVAKVNDNVLTQYELDSAYNEILPAASFHGGITPEKKEKYHQQALKKMIEDELLYQEAVRLGLNIDRDVVRDDVMRTIEKVGGKKQYEAALKNAGMTEAEYMAKLKRQRLIEKITEVEIEEKSKISDEEAQKYYEENKSTFKMPQSWRLRHILITVPASASQEQWEAGKKRAEEALKKIRDGEDMASVAWDYSDDPYRVKGGDLGIVHSGRLVPELEEAIKKLDVGQTSGVVQSIYGYHIVRVEDKTEPQQLGFDDVRERIKSQLALKRRMKLQDELIEKLKSSAKIEVY